MSTRDEIQQLRPGTVFRVRGDLVLYARAFDVEHGHHVYAVRATGPGEQLPIDGIPAALDAEIDVLATS